MREYPYDRVGTGVCNIRVLIRDRAWLIIELREERCSAGTEIGKYVGNRYDLRIWEREKEKERKRVRYKFH